MALPRGQSHFVNAKLRALGWYADDSGVPRPINALLDAMSRRLQVESLARLNACMAEGRGTRPTGQEQADELQRRLVMVKLHIIANQLASDSVYELVESITNDSAGFLKDVNAWDAMPQMWLDTYEVANG